MILESTSNAGFKPQTLPKLENVDYSAEGFPSAMVDDSGTTKSPNLSSIKTSAKRMIEDGVNFQPVVLLKRCKLDANQNCKELEDVLSSKHSYSRHSESVDITEVKPHSLSKLEGVEYSSDNFPSIIVAWSLDKLQLVDNLSGTTTSPNLSSTKKSTSHPSAKRMDEEGVNFQPKVLLERCKLDVNQNYKKLKNPKQLKICLKKCDSWPAFADNWSKEPDNVRLTKITSATSINANIMSKSPPKENDSNCDKLNEKDVQASKEKNVSNENVFHRVTLIRNTTIFSSYYN